MTPQPSEQPRTAADEALHAAFWAMGSSAQIPIERREEFTQMGMRLLKAELALRHLAIEAEAAAPDPVGTNRRAQTEALRSALMDEAIRGGQPYEVSGRMIALVDHYLSKAAAPDPVASPLDVERLAVAIANASDLYALPKQSWLNRNLEPSRPNHQGKRLARQVAAEYARLEGQPVAEEPDDG